MAKDTIENQINILIGLLENFPKRMADEIERREELKKIERLKKCQADLDFLRDHQTEINKMMYGVDTFSQEEKFK